MIILGCQDGVIAFCFDNSSVRDGCGVLRLIIGGQYHRPLIMVPIELGVKLRMNVPKRVDTTGGVLNLKP